MPAVNFKETFPSDFLPFNFFYQAVPLPSGYLRVFVITPFDSQKIPLHCAKTPHHPLQKGDISVFS